MKYYVIKEYQIFIVRNWIWSQVAVLLLDCSQVAVLLLDLKQPVQSYIYFQKFLQKIPVAESSF